MIRLSQRSDSKLGSNIWYLDITAIKFDNMGIEKKINFEDEETKKDKLRYRKTVEKSNAVFQITCNSNCNLEHILWRKNSRNLEERVGGAYVVRVVYAPTRGKSINKLGPNKDSTSRHSTVADFIEKKSPLLPSMWSALHPAAARRVNLDGLDPLRGSHLFSYFNWK